jgi:hypothetical protein
MEGVAYHDVPNHHQRRTANEQDRSSVDSPTNEWDQDSEEGADDVGRDGVELLGYDGVFGVDCADDGWGEEC